MPASPFAGEVARSLWREMEGYPVESEPRAKLLAALREERVPDAIRAIETSVGLTLAVLRAANRTRRFRRETATVRQAVEGLGAARVATVTEGLPTYEPLGGSAVWHGVPGPLCAHSVAVRAVAERLAGGGDSGRLRAAALLSGIGKPLLARVHGRRASVIYAEPLSADDELTRERAALGTDHALAGAELLRRWHFPESLADSVETRAGELGAVVRVADMLVRYGEGAVVDVDELTRSSAAIGVPRELLSELMYELPDAFSRGLPAAEPCPLSERELDVLRLLAQGRLYKQIGDELGLATSTVRSHLHRIYTRIGVADRTQAVLKASRLNWI